MSIKSALFGYLTAQAGISAIVSARIYPVKLPQASPLPAITYRRVTGGHEHNLKGALGTSLARFQLHCWADSYQDADTLAEAIRQAMDGFSGNMGAVDVRSVTLHDEEDEYEHPEDGSDNGVYLVTLDYLIRYSESIPQL